ncbi:hypothetical protein [Chryseobacterium sp. CT-SW4]|uniref:hypothetical protein n=1 Tax=Chryseobacterium sp. SW-1 TaxID=3157343 RepID=UPI003B02AEB2
METLNHNTSENVNIDVYTTQWDDIENTEIDYDSYLNEIESFFKEDVENNIPEEEIFPEMF